MVSNTRPPVSAAIAAVTNGTDEATRIAACRGVLREAGKLCMQIGAGVLVEGVEEVRFFDALQREMLEYLKAKRSGVDGAAYVGITANLAASVEATASVVAARAPDDDPERQHLQHQGAAS